MYSSSKKKATTFIDGEVSSDKHEAGQSIKNWFVNMYSSSKKKATTFIDGEVSSDKHEAGQYMFENDGILDKIS
ncbi:hypothetical protein CFP56_007904 [Quercus suber]|uniref:Uncharacterized protein n=1 Tax=Quercus suber TaxID=58331 RepID=A0AAW0L627_QUESU